MKILTAHQPAYLPWLGYFHKIAISDVFVILDDVQLEKNGFSNRNKIKGPNGAFWLTVPIAMDGHTHKTIKDMKINNKINWRKKHFRSIQDSYRKAPYYEQYINFFEDCYSREWDNLVDLTEFMLKWFLDQLSIDVELRRMSEYSFQDKKSDLVLSVIKKFDADLYVSGSCGKDYIKQDSFKDNNIDIYFQEYLHPEYNQLHKDFVSHMSVLDLLFNYGGKKAFEIIMDKNVSKDQLKSKEIKL